MRWNLFRRTDTSDASDSSFETTVVDDAAAARLAQAPSADGVVGPPPAPVLAGIGPGMESESIGHVGRYALKTILGKGGLGTVYAAWDPLLSRTVALKTLHIDADPAARETLDALFLNEARAAAGLSHPHIVTVFDAGPSDTGVYIAMERLQGQDLRHLLLQGVRPGPVEAAQVVRRVADALAYAHRKGVVHCDIKPANIFMTGRMHPKVLDFGIARVAHRDVPALEGLMAGSPYYLAPEQMDGRSVDRRSDVYSLGVVLYELLVGKKPFEGKSLEEISAAVKAGDAVPAHRVSPKIPLGLSVIAARAMERDPEQRYPSARHLSMELRHWVDSAEARALRSDARAPAPVPMGSKIARIAVPLAAIAMVGGVLAWMKLGSPSLDNRAAAPVPASASEAVRVAAAGPSAVTIAPSAVAAEEAAAASAAAARSATTNAALALDPGSGTAPAPAASAAASVAAPASVNTASGIGAGDAIGAKPVVSKAEAARRRKASALASVTGGVPMTAVLAEGVVQLAVSPWGQVEVDGKPMGISPPLTRLTLSSGSHTITVRNTDYPAYTATVTVDGESPVTLRHRFGP
jgi:eukaryotic-like serine/threonine-protein kinase